MGEVKKKIKIYGIILVLAVIVGGFSFNFFFRLLNESQSPNSKLNTNKNQLIDLKSQADNSVNCSSNFEMFEYANITSTKNNISTIDIEMPSAGWNVSNIQLNFTDIRLKEETFVIASENESSSFWRLRRKDIESLAMQITIPEQIKLFSVQIFGFSLGRNVEESEVSVKITDWNSGSHIPDMSTTYGSSISLNISNIPHWYIQKFSVPIDLDPGDYAIVLDGIDTLKDGIDIFWFINESNPNPLYMSYYYKVAGPFWDWDYIQYEVFCHKLTWRVNRLYNPSDINMTARVNEIPFQVSDGYSDGKGFLKVSNVSVSVPETTFNIVIENNQSMPLIFNLIYTVHLSNLELVDLSVRINEGKDNKWRIIPSIERCSCNYSVRFKIPQNWYNLTIYKNDIEVSSDPNIIFDGDILQIKNDTITPNSDWLISAQNNPLNFTLNSQKTVFNPADDFEVTIQSSFLNGEYSFFLIDSNNEEKYQESKIVSGPTEQFSYIVRSDDIEGEWNALVFWHNQTDAGVEILTFMVEIPFVLTPLLIFIISITSIGTVGVAYGSYRIVKRKKRIRELNRRKIIDKCMDIVNLNYFLVTDKKSSLTLFDQKYVKKGQDPILISGFLEAIRAFGIELTETAIQSQIVKLEYQNLKVIMNEYSDFRIILIMKEVPSNEFLNSLKELSYELVEKFGKFLVDFKGDIRPFKYIDRLIIKHLNGSLLYPLKLIATGETKISAAEKELITKISEIKKSYQTEYMYFKDLVEKNVYDQEEILLIDRLVQKGVLKPILKLK